jgi:hypothetical protein
VSATRAKLVHQPRGTQRYQPTQRNDEDALTRAIITLADPPSELLPTGQITHRDCCVLRIWNGSLLRINHPVEGAQSIGGHADRRFSAETSS